MRRESIDPQNCTLSPSMSCFRCFQSISAACYYIQISSDPPIWSLPGTLAYPHPSFSLYHLFSQYLIQFSFNKWLLFLKCRSLQNKTEAPNLVCKTSNGCFLHPSIICTLLADPYLFVILSQRVLILEPVIFVCVGVFYLGCSSLALDSSGFFFLSYYYFVHECFTCRN